MRSVIFHPEAKLELEAAVEWYEGRKDFLGNEFYGMTQRAVDTIARSTETYPKYLYNTRRLILQRFPFSIVYRVRPAKIQIIAVAHHSRRPGYWKNRSF